MKLREDEESALWSGLRTGLLSLDDIALFAARNSAKSNMDKKKKKSRFRMSTDIVVRAGLRETIGMGIKYGKKFFGSPVGRVASAAAISLPLGLRQAWKELPESVRGRILRRKKPLSPGMRPQESGVIERALIREAVGMTKNIDYATLKKLHPNHPPPVQMAKEIKAGMKLPLQDAKVQLGLSKLAPILIAWIIYKNFIRKDK